MVDQKANDLLALLEAIKQSGSRLEDEFWEQRLNQAVSALFAEPDSTLLEQLLDYLAATDQADLYDVLATTIESQAETVSLSHQGEAHQVLLITAPITVWTRYQLPNGLLNTSQHEQLLTLMKRYVSSHAKVAVLGQLLSFDQLPQNYAETHALCQQLGRFALDAKTAEIEIDQREDGIHLLADTLFVVAAVAIPRGKEVFAWQESAHPLTTQPQAQAQWQEQCQAILSSLFIGCQSEYVAPNGYYHNLRASDKQMRPLALQAAVQWLAMITDSPLEEIHATIVRCGHEETEEFRIGLGIEADPSILYGCVWPIFSQEETDVSHPNYEDTALTLQHLLTDLGVESIHFLAGLFEPEFCDDCHAPSFPTSSGKLQHPHLPDELDLSPTAIH